MEIRHLTLGSCPDSWGVWFADDPRQTPWPRFLDEMAAAGYSWLELGPYGYLPTDPARLADELAQRGLSVAGGTVGGVGGPHKDFDAVLAETRKVAALASALRSRNVVYVPVPGYRDDVTNAYLEPAELDPGAWRALVTNTNTLGRMVFEEYGVHLRFHPHADYQVETQAQTERLLDDTDPRYVSLCLDTGHLAYRKADVPAIIRKYPDRIGYVHIKQMDPVIAERAAREDLAFGRAVAQGASVEPPAGEPDVPTVLAALGELGTELFVVVEQDMYPVEFDVPLPIARRTRAYLNSVGLHSRPTTSGDKT
ncbi:TIM barrel protein [Paractinoplanes brasiliensis]|uniref:2-keto-myo-inositol dehydratase n=1 Tax=Paractinoplanes brasiliensis TaxID=52695 RepID=A0A4R6K5N0_9ACTN|nr:TIM barrel protein [Actinoplanes brasiliensis]TDO42575.1 2-keto-myo-inositol dehydratase [Actinoplanes brasiliensis]GID31320.1 IolE protein [Actinoplanes brasiliensis]